MSQITPSSTSSSNNQLYLVGISLGALFGLLAAFLYARASAEADGARQIRTGEMISLSLAALGLVRQITEAGKPRK